jgi:hypothetical protein
MEKKLTNSGPLMEPADKHSIYTMNISTARCTHDKSDITEEPCAGKLASTVLETSREG